MSKKSYEKVNYLLRPKKQIERKMIIEALQQLSQVIDIQNYHYFGFGSIYFADFILFHKYLNISTMTSIDKEQDDKQRFLFNKPYDFVTFEISDARTFMEKRLNWDEKLFIWLDYDSALDTSIIEDIEFVSAKSKPLNLFLVTVEAKEPKEPKEFFDEFESYTSPQPITPETFPKLLHGIIKTCVSEGLRKRSEKVNFLQLFNLTYEDTKPMYTFGGIFYSGTMDNELKSEASKLSLLSYNDNVVEINCPILTPREKLHLDSCVKIDNVCEDPANATGLKKEDIDKYAKFYKYYPQFFESVY